MLSFEREKITPDIMCRLSVHELKYLGINNSSDMMRLRIECMNYGHGYSNTSRDLNEPKYDIPKEILVTFIESGFKVSEISKLLSVSERTIYRRMNKFNITRYDFTDIDDINLEREVRHVTTEFPRVGETMIRQILHEKGIKVTRSRLREVLHRIDQVGITERLRRRLHRRVHNVSAPNHLWHLDTNHKLIRWHFIICGGIDGFSRFVVYLKCENNNKAVTILQCFTNAVAAHGTPLRVRTDQGMENIKVAEYMIHVRGLNRRSVIAGKSTHNQRIERLWRDVYEGVLCFYYDLFHFMEDNEILDPLDETHIYALHFVFMDQINEKLQLWKLAWARHRLRTARSSPLRLFTAGSLNYPVDILDTDLPMYGVVGNIELNAADNSAEINDTRPALGPLDLQITNDCRQELDLNCPPNWNSNNYGIDVYLKAKEIVQRHML